MPYIGPRPSRQGGLYFAHLMIRVDGGQVYRITGRRKDPPPPLGPVAGARLRIVRRDRRVSRYDGPFGGSGFLDDLLGPVLGHSPVSEVQRGPKYAELTLADGTTAEWRVFGPEATLDAEAEAFRALAAD